VVQHLRDLVTVVIPALNAEDTLDATLASVRAQTYRELEIIVVDDGSTDSTVSVARRHATQDERVIVVTAKHGGVASARNIGIAMSRGKLIAPIDSDDLWHPLKTERQVALMHAKGPGTGFVYTLFRRIDKHDVVLRSQRPEVVEGQALNRLLSHNFVGNGSSLMIRREAVQEVGGYEAGLYRSGAQGCEDYLLQLLIARKWLVACVPEYLTAYRRHAKAMSRDWAAMARSRLLVLDYLARVEGEPRVDAGALRAAEAAVRIGLSFRLMTEGRPGAAAVEAMRAFRLSGAAAARAASQNMPWRIAARKRTRRSESRAFCEMDPRDPDLPGRSDREQAVWRRSGGWSDVPASFGITAGVQAGLEPEGGSSGRATRERPACGGRAARSDRSAR
jgi:hypothetical protein